MAFPWVSWCSSSHFHPNELPHSDRHRHNWKVKPKEKWYWLENWGVVTNIVIWPLPFLLIRFHMLLFLVFNDSSANLLVAPVFSIPWRHDLGFGLTVVKWPYWPKETPDIVAITITLHGSLQSLLPIVRIFRKPFVRLARGKWAMKLTIIPRSLFGEVIFLYHLPRVGCSLKSVHCAPPPTDSMVVGSPNGASSFWTRGKWELRVATTITEFGVKPRMVR